MGQNIAQNVRLCYAGLVESCGWFCAVSSLHIRSHCQEQIKITGEDWNHKWVAHCQDHALQHRPDAAHKDQACLCSEDETTTSAAQHQTQPAFVFCSLKQGLLHAAEFSAYTYGAH